jgi:hypothetical protein
MSKLPVALRDERERAIAVLSDLFAHDRMDMNEFDRRISLAHRAESVAELAELTKDFATDLPVTAPTSRPSTALVPVSQVRESQTLVAIMGGVSRSGTWSSAKRVRVWALMGGGVLDFREARLPPGVTTVSIFAVMGGVQIIVPPGLAVEMDGAALMGGFEHMERSPVQPDPDQPILRVTGFAIMGGVSVETRLPGETEGDAKRRRKKERKLLRAKNEE